MSLEDEPNWALLGEGIVAFARRRKGVLPPLPYGLHRIPGPVVILVENFIDSPVGPYVSLSIGEPVRLGLRPGFYFSTSVLSSTNARRIGRLRWGFPHELGSLVWSTDANVRSVIWDERQMEVRASVASRPMPILLPLRVIQRRGDGAVVIPTRLKALAYRSRVEVALKAGDPLFSIGGVHRGFVLSGMLIRRNAARRALGWISTLRAPVHSAEPGVLGMNKVKKRKVWGRPVAPG